MKTKKVAATRLSISIVIEDSEDALDPSELAEFLYLFRGANVALSRIVPARDKINFHQPDEAYVQYVKHEIAGLGPKQLNALFNPKTSPDILKIDSITRNSPMGMVVVGCVAVVTLAVVVSGGKIQISADGVKAHLPPLGTGIKSLLEAFRLNRKLKVGFGLQELKVKLTKPQYRELMLPIKGQGGFQDFFRSLQARIKKNTRTLTLTQDDLERIYRMKRDPKAGGWQGRLDRIFSRHLPDKLDTATVEVQSPELQRLPRYTPKKKEIKLLTEGSGSAS